MKRIWIIGISLTIAIVAFVFFQNNDADTIDYNTQVKPILNKKCITCHGGVKREADFSLLFRQEALSKAESGNFPIVPGDVAHSELVRRITSNDPEVRMPYKKEPLTTDEISVLTKWIEQGAPWGDHWAYVPVKEQPVPKETDWTKTDIDKIILARIEEEGLHPSSQATKEMLLRRVSLDIIGMPADEKLAKEYLSSTSPTAYEALVDSLLNSPHFGERWTSVWLDVARYSDTKGYERDYVRSIWRYRDWVIKALNRDMPYDSFLIEQIAGDLLPNPTDEQYIATAFHRNSMTNDEGGTENEEFRTAAVLDRTNTTWEGLMGTSFGCVQCHSHPYDPFRHDEYYKFMAFFNDTRDEDTYEDYPLLRHFEKGDQQKLAELTSWIKDKVSPEKANEINMLEKMWQPATYSIAADEMANSALTDTKWLSLRNHATCRFKNITMTGRKKMIYRYQAYVDGRWELHADSPDGPLVKSFNVKKTVPKDQWIMAETDITPYAGVHDLYFTYTSPNLKEYNQSGMMFDWFYFTDELIPTTVAGADQKKKELWSLLTKDVETTPVMMENPADFHRVSQVFERGNWLAKTDTVAPGVPASLLKFPEGAPRNRLGLAQWIVDKNNPLTSRTIVNRVWEQIYGVGIVETLEDFGTQGIPPTHPELIDYLAWKLMNDYKWSLKKLIREIVMSATYQQDSKVSPEMAKGDPTNKLYARAPRVRLTAEQVRDQTLSVCGLLSNKMYGPGVMPYQPEGVWLTPYNGNKWKKSKGEEQYRRAVYVYWKRTAPYPSMMTFDGSAREVCTVRRIRTNTPLQALVTLNDSVYVEAAEHLAIRMKAKSGDVSEQIKSGYEIALGRAASPQEIDVLRRLYDKLSSHQVKNVSARKNEDASDSQDEAMMLVANAILNLDEFITKN